MRMLYFVPLFVALASAEIVTVSSQDSDAVDRKYGLIKNEKFKQDHSLYFGKHMPIGAYEYDLIEILDRQRPFEHPPKAVLDELQRDGIRDAWEVGIRQDENEAINQPIIGIITQPVNPSKFNHFSFRDYILEINDNFIRWSGSRTVRIPFDIQEQELAKLLPKINGVLFTGGSLDLINTETGEHHPYYTTSKRIFEYSQKLKQ